MIPIENGGCLVSEAPEADGIAVVGDEGDAIRRADENP